MSLTLLFSNIHIHIYTWKLEFAVLLSLNEDIYFNFNIRLFILNILKSIELTVQFFHLKWNVPTYFSKRCVQVFKIYSSWLSLRVKWTYFIDTKDLSSFKMIRHQWCSCYNCMSFFYFVYSAASVFAK